MLRYRIAKNVIECAHCGTLIPSIHRHDFRTHGCAGLEAKYGTENGWIAADGGTAYLRRLGRQEDWIERSEQITEEVPDGKGEK